MNKKIVLSVLSATVVASMASSAFAAPSAGLYIGGDVHRFYGFDYLLDLKTEIKANVAKLVAAQQDNQIVFVLPDGRGYDVKEVLAGRAAGKTLEQILQDKLKKADFLDSYDVVKKDGTVSGIEKPKDKITDDQQPGTGGIDSVTAKNLKQVEVKFTKAVDATEGAKLANYFVAKEGALNTNVATGNGAKVELASDLKSAVITLADGQNFTNFTTANKVTVSKAVGLTADYSKTDLAASDTANPTLESVTSTGPREITLVFSEPLNRTVGPVSSFLLDNGAIALDTFNYTYIDAEKKLVIKTYSDLTAGAHTLKIKSATDNQLKDYSGASVIPVEKTFTHVIDTTPPTVAVKASSERTVTLKFNKPVVNLDSSKVQFSHTYRGLNAVYGTTLGAVTKVGSDEYTIKFDNPFNPGTTKMYIDYVTGTTNAEMIKDNYGNVLQPTALDINTIADNTKPEVAAVDFVNSTTLKVTFSEDVEAGFGPNGAENATNYVLKDSTGAVVPILGARFATNPNSNKVVELTTARINGGAYSLEIKNIKDRSIAKNMLDTVTKNFVAVDTVAPDVDDLAVGTGSKYDGVLLGDNKVRIGFTEPMKKESIENKDNYQWNAQAIPAGVVLTASADLKSVVFDFTNAKWSNGTPITVSPSHIFKVGRVEDLAGNKIAAFETEVRLVQNTTLGVASIEAVSKNQIKLTFNENLVNVNAYDFAIDADGDGSATFKVAGGASVNNEAGKTYITLISQDTIKTGFDSENDKPVVRTIGRDASGNPLTGTPAPTTNTSNQYGNKIFISNAKATDKVVPELIEKEKNPIETIDQNNDGKIDHIRVSFTELMSPAYINAASFAVAGYEILGVTTDSDGIATSVTDTGDGKQGKFVLITVKQKDTPDIGAKPAVTVGTIRDVAGNAFTPVTLSPSDKTQPTAIVTAGPGGDKILSAAEKASGFTVTAQSNKYGKLYVVEDGKTYSDEATLKTVSIADAYTQVLNADTNISVPANASIDHGKKFNVVAVDTEGNLSSTVEAFTADLKVDAPSVGGTETELVLTFSEDLYDNQGKALAATPETSTVTETTYVQAASYSNGALTLNLKGAAADKQEVNLKSVYDKVGNVYGPETFIYDAATKKWSKK